MWVDVTVGLQVGVREDVGVGVVVYVAGNVGTGDWVQLTVSVYVTVAVERRKGRT